MPSKKMVLDKKQRSAALEFTKQKDPLEGMVKVEGKLAE
jgi:hypothetical protein